MLSKEKEGFCIFILFFKVQALEMNEIFDYLLYRETDCFLEIFMLNYIWLYMFVF